MFGQRSRNDDYEPTDTLVVFKDNGTADILDIVGINDERVLAGPFVGDEEQYSIPLNDLKVYTGKRGRVFLWPTTIDNVTDCQRIAALERSTVLRQITHFDQDQVIPPKPISKLLIFGVLAVMLLIIIMAVS